MANGELKYTEGPSAEQWECHRETITQLYYKMSLKDLSDYMKTRHSFHASKRMYDSRFRRWQVFKTMKKAEREKLKLSQSASPQSEPKLAELKVQRKASKARVIQQKRRPLERLAPRLHVDTNSQPEQCLPSPNTVKSEGCETPENKALLYYSSGCTSPEAPQTANLPPSPEDSTCVNTPSSMTTATAPLVPKEPEVVLETQVAPAKPTGGRQFYDYLERPHPPKYQTLPSISPPRLIAADVPDRRVKMMLANIEAFYDRQFDQLTAEHVNYLVPQDAMDMNKMITSTASNQFWSNINTGIYLLKVSHKANSTAVRPDRAFSAFQEGCNTAAEALSNPSLDFPLQLLGRLSPTNTRVCLSLRSNLLVYLAGMSLTKLGSNHPITIICEALKSDDHCDQVSQKGIEYIRILLQKRHGSASCKALDFEIWHLQTKLRRRSGDLEGAVVQAEQLHVRTLQQFGDGAKQTRLAMSELAHAYMATKQYDRAMVLCQGVIRNSHVDAQELLNDGIAAHAMEDIAELYQNAGDSINSIAWLEKAATIALQLWERSMATGHIVDKLTELLEQCGRTDEAKSWKGMLQK